VIDPKKRGSDSAPVTIRRINSGTDLEVTLANGDQFLISYEDRDILFNYRLWRRSLYILASKLRAE
jgi:hypothetical protein